MRLTDEERAMLDGRRGPAVKKAMEIVTALARIYGAKELVPVSSVNVSGVSYKNLTDHGIAFIKEWAASGARATVPTTLNPAGMDLVNWRIHGVPEDFASKQHEVMDAFAAMGIPPTCTCTPYLAGNVPAFGEHIAWGESSAVCYANSVLGARTNREGGPSALASAVCGRTGLYGYHLDENRLASVMVDVECPVESPADFGALGRVVAEAAGSAVVYFRNLKATRGELKALGASLAAWGGVALFHVDGVTPEAIRGNMLGDDPLHLSVDSLKEPLARMNDDISAIDLVSVGCPHASAEELERIAGEVSGSALEASLWVTTSRHVRDASPDAVATIEKAGGFVVADACVVVSPVRSMGFSRLATNSAKMAHYAPGHCGMSVRFGTLEQCIEAARTGRWPE